MISCHKNFLAQRCEERGYSLEEVMPCVISQDGDTWMIDTNHPAYPLASRHTAPHPSSRPEKPTGGPGTHLKAFFLKWFGQKATPNCSCNAVARQMDTQGPEWCRANMDWICEQIRLNAEKRGLPYIRAVVEPIVLLAIRRAEKDARKTAK